jgi:hypothetical protein
MSFIKIDNDDLNDINPLKDKLTRFIVEIPNKKKEET